jgi:hypothetical protein
MHMNLSLSPHSAIETFVIVSVAPELAPVAFRKQEASAERDLQERV